MMKCPGFPRQSLSSCSSYTPWWMIPFRLLLWVTLHQELCDYSQSWYVIRVVQMGEWGTESEHCLPQGPQRWPSTQCLSSLLSADVPGTTRPLGLKGRRDDGCESKESMEQTTNPVENKNVQKTWIDISTKKTGKQWPTSSQKDVPHH